MRKGDAARDAGQVPALRAHRVGMRFTADGRERVVLRGIDLEIAAGEFVCILGSSGAGKSTLLNLLAGFLVPTEGTVEASGEPVTGPDRRRIVVFQERGTFPWLTVAGNVGFGLRELSVAERNERIQHYVELVGLKGFERNYPAELSGGMRQRLEVARALAVNPEMLLLDEPFGALDSITRMEMRRELLRIWQAERKTIVCVTHDVDEAVQLADRVVLLGGSPATVQQIIDVQMEHPRRLDAAEYLRVRDSIYEGIGMARQV